MKLPIRKYLDLSTGHVTQSDARILDAAATKPSSPAGIYSAGESGCWFIPIDADTEWNDIGNLSEPFRGLVEFALRHGCDLLHFDRDGPILDCLPSFDW